MIKKLLLLLSLVFCQAALAKNPASDTLNKKPWIAFDFAITPSVAYFFYQEYWRAINYGVLMDVKGPLYGFETNLKINVNPTGLGFMVVPFDIAMYDGGKLVYTGSAGSSGSGTQDAYGSLIQYNIHFFLFWYRFLAGPSWTFFDHYRFNFLSGYGYKYTFNTFSEDERHWLSRINRLNYVPWVLQFQYRGDVVTALLHAEYDILLHGIQESRFISGGAGHVGDIIFMLDEQKVGWGARALAEFSFYGITIAPFFNYFWVDDSHNILQIYEGMAGDPNLSGEEPRNITIETGVKVGYQF